MLIVADVDGVGASNENLTCLRHSPYSLALAMNEQHRPLYSHHHGGDEWWWLLWVDPFEVVVEAVAGMFESILLVGVLANAKTERVIFAIVEIFATA